MGLFSTKYVTVVGTNVVRVIKDELLPDAVKTGVSKALFQNGDIPEYIMEESAGSIGRKAEQMYKYAKRSYTHGLPSGTFVSASQGIAQVTAILSDIEGQPVTVEYSHMTPPNSMHLGWMQLLAHHGYDPVTNQFPGLSAQIGHTVFLDDMELVVPKSQIENFRPGSLDLWGKPARALSSPSRPDQGFLASMVEHPPLVADAQATDDYIRVTYAWVKPGTPNTEDDDHDRVLKGSFNIPITDDLADPSKDFFHVQYSVNGLTKFWLYQVGLGTYPSLDALFNTEPSTSGTFFPFAYFRYEAKAENEDKTTDSYKTSKKLVKYLGMDFDEVAAAIDENPDVKDVQQAMLVMAVPASTESELERRYLFDFFSNAQRAKNRKYGTVVQGEVAAHQAKDPNHNRSTIVIEDKRFKMALSDTGIFRRMVVGRVAEVGQHTSGSSREATDVVNFLDAETASSIPVENFIRHHYYRKQLTPNLYEEIVVVNLQMLYYVFGEYTTTADETDDILLIPLDHSITTKYSANDREELYARSLHFVFNSKQVIKIKWYQQWWFAAIMQILSVVLTAMSLGTASPLLVSIAAKVGIALTTPLLIAIGNLLVGMVVGALFKLFVKMVGVDLAFLGAIVLAAFGFAQAFEAGSIAGAPFATELLQLSSGLVGGIQGTIQDLFKDLAGEYSALAFLKEENDKMFETANKLLETNNHLSPFVIFGESPNDFYNRTVHSGNVGLNGISAISSYVDIALKLPTLDETIGENTYG